MAILMVSTFGTTFGDFIAGDLGLGLSNGSIVLGMLLTIVLYLEINARGFNETRYWAVVALVRTTGTVMGDFITTERGLNLGFGIGATLIAALLLIALIIPKNFRASRKLMALIDLQENH